MLWLRDYEKYYKEGDFMEGLFSLLGFSSISLEETPDKPIKMDFSKIDDFLLSPFYKHWKAVLKLGEKK